MVDASKETHGTTQDTLMARLDAIVDPTVQINFFKLDVEGFECNALRGAEGIFRRKQVDLIFVEVNYGMLERGGCSPNELKRILASLCIDVSDFPDTKPGTNPDFTGRSLSDCQVTQVN